MFGGLSFFGINSSGIETSVFKMADDYYDTIDIFLDAVEFQENIVQPMEHVMHMWSCVLVFALTLGMLLYAARNWLAKNQIDVSRWNSSIVNNNVKNVLSTPTKHWNSSIAIVEDDPDNDHDLKSSISDTKTLSPDPDSLKPFGTGSASQTNFPYKNRTL